MSNTKTVMGQAANTQGIPLDIPDVFSTYLYTGNGGTQTVTNGIDLSGEGGMVWLKERSSSDDHKVFDTERGAEKRLSPNLTAAEANDDDELTAFNSNGFSLGPDSNTNDSGQDYASWSFLKAAKFFDVQTWTGSGVAGRTVSHNLGSVPGCIIIKSTNDTQLWYVYHKELGNGYDIFLNQTNAKNNANTWNYTDPTSTEFTLSSSRANVSGNTYVAYLFAHNDGDGEFGPAADQDIIKCGSYTGNGSSSGVEVDLGFEPQWILVKSATQSSTNWTITDVMRGWTVGNGQNYIYPHTSAAEVSTTTNLIDPLPNGFKVFGTGSNFNTSGQTYIYMAIRRGPLNPPTAGTEVFATNDVDNGASAPDSLSGFPVDMYFRRYVNTTNDTYLLSRLTGTGAMKTNATNAEVSFSTASAGFDYNNGVMNIFSTNNTDFHTWMWKRAPSYFDSVAFLGSGVAGRTVSHNLGVVPEMIWVKRRNSTGHWYVYHTGMTGGSDALHSTARLNLDGAGFNTQSWKNYDFTTAHFSLDNAADINGSGGTYIAYLFATLAGVSKVGSVTHSGTTNVDCGFSAGSRFVMLKRTDATGDWYIWDSVRGIIAGNDPYLLLNSTAAEVTNTDYIDPLSSGFTISDAFTDGDYIFYAIA